MRTGVFHGGTDVGFTTAYLHWPDELAGEITDAGFVDAVVRPVEGPGFLLADVAAGWADAARRDAVMDAARLVEDRPELAATTGHMLCTARRPA